MNRLGRSLFIHLIVLIAAASPGAETCAQSTAQGPWLRIKSPFAAPIWRLDVDRDERFAVVSNSDKSAVIWTLGDSAPPAIARLPIRDEQRWRAHGVAISPDGARLAYSVPPLANPGSSDRGDALIYILDRASGEIVDTLPRLPQQIPTRPQALRFSPDGKYLAAVLSDHRGLRIWSTADWQLVGSDDAGYSCATDPGCSGDTTDLLMLSEESGKPWIFTAGDTGVRAYSAVKIDMLPLETLNPAQLKLGRPGGLAASPDGTRLVVADRRKVGDQSATFSFTQLDRNSLASIGPQFGLSDRSDVWDRKDELRPADWAQMAFHRAAWVRHGNEDYLFAGGALPCFQVQKELLLNPSNETLDKQICILRWKMGTNDGEPRFIPVGTDRVVDLLGLPRRGGVLVGALRRVAAIGVGGERLERSDRPLLRENNVNADYRVTDFAARDFRVAVDGSQVEFQDYSTSERIRFDVRSLRLTELDALPSALPDPEDPGDLITGWQNSQRVPQVRGAAIKDVAPLGNEFFRHVARSQQNGRILIGSSEALRVASYDANQAWQSCAPLKVSEEAFRVALPENAADLAVVAHSDGTIRWYRIGAPGADCKLRLVLSVYLYQTAGGQWTWTAWRPSGKFARSGASRSIIEWQTSSAKKKVLRTPLLDYDWDAVSQALEPDSDGDAADADGISEQAENAGVRAVNPNPSTRAARYEFELEFEDVERWPKKLVIRVCDGPVLKTEFKGRTYSSLESIELKAEHLTGNTAGFAVELPASLRRISGIQIQLCIQLDGRSIVTHSVTWEGAPVKITRRKLNAILIGAADYADARIAPLSFSDNDALDMARFIVDDFEGRSPFGRYFDDIEIDLFISTGSSYSKAEIGALTASKKVRSWPAEKSEIITRLDDLIQQRIDGDPETENLFLFYYSGHGFTSAKGQAALALPSLKFDLSNVDASVLFSDELSHLIKQIDARKVIIFDACRTRMGGEFDPGRVRSKIGDPPGADFFFSSTKAQASLSLAGLHLDERRPKERWGNSLFSYALLKALQDPQRVTKSETWKIVTFSDIGAYLRTYFRELQDKDNPARQGAEFEKLTYVPLPDIDTQSPDKVVRMRK